MIKIYLFLFLLLFNYSYAISNQDDIIKKNLKILYELDLDDSYINNEGFKKYYENTYKKFKSSYARKIKNATPYIKIIKETFRNNNMPESLLYLAMAESNFIIKARSPKKAMGLWQFIPSTARAYNLDMGYYTDERMDPKKSSTAASQYLLRLYGMFGKWYLAVLAYNCGEARVIEAITRATLDMYCLDNKCKKDPQIIKYRNIIKGYQQKRVKFSKLYKVYKIVKEWKYKPGINELLIIQDKLSRQYLPQESRDYIKKIISLAMMSNDKNIIINSKNMLNNDVSKAISRVRVKGGILISDVAEVIGMPRDEMNDLNPHILRNVIPPANKYYDIYIPNIFLGVFNKNIKSIKKIKTKIFEIYIVKSGDNLSSIAELYSTRYIIIKKYNNLKSDFLRINQRLLIPLDLNNYKIDKTYVVKNGDNLLKIARKYGVSTQKIIDTNNIKNNKIYKGDKLVIKYR